MKILVLWYKGEKHFRLDPLLNFKYIRSVPCRLALPLLPVCTVLGKIYPHSCIISMKNI